MVRVVRWRPIFLTSQRPTKQDLHTDLWGGIPKSKFRTLSVGLTWLPRISRGKIPDNLSRWGLVPKWMRYTFHSLVFIWCSDFSATYIEIQRTISCVLDSLLLVYSNTKGWQHQVGWPEFTAKDRKPIPIKSPWIIFSRDCHSPTWKISKFAGLEHRNQYLSMVWMYLFTAHSKNM